MKCFVVYIATNVSNGYRYVGYTSNGLQKRRVAHLGRARRNESGCPKFHNAIRKYGQDAFSWKVVAVFASAGEALAEEIRLIAEFHPEYNLSNGGEGRTGLPAWNRKKVTCLSDGRIFASGTAAAIEYGISPMAIFDVCNGKYRYVKGKYFAWGDTIYEKKSLDALIRKIEHAHAQRRKRTDNPKSYRGIVDGKDNLGRSAAGPVSNARPVTCIDDGMVFPSASAAARHYSVCRSSLIELCNGKNTRKTVGGCRFKYLENINAEVS